MSQQSPPPSHPNQKHRRLPQGRAKLIAFEEAMRLVAAIKPVRAPRGFSFARDHLVRAAGNTALRLSEASGRTMGNRYQHLEAAYAESQETQTALQMISEHGGDVPEALLRQASRVGGLIFGLLRAEARARGE
jgi:hypothetical protein